MCFLCFDLEIVLFFGGLVWMNGGREGVKE